MLILSGLFRPAPQYMLGKNSEYRQSDYFLFEHGSAECAVAIALSIDCELLRSVSFNVKSAQDT
jgi:hypothetical protein